MVFGERLHCTQISLMGRGGDRVTTGLDTILDLIFLHSCLRQCPCHTTEPFSGSRPTTIKSGLRPINGNGTYVTETKISGESIQSTVWLTCLLRALFGVIPQNISFYFFPHCTAHLVVCCDFSPAPFCTPGMAVVSPDQSEKEERNVYFSPPSEKQHTCVSAH